MKNKIEDLRNYLFDVIERLLDDDEGFDLDRARAISDAAQTIVNMSKVEVEFLKAMKSQKGSGFFPALEDAKDPK